MILSPNDESRAGSRVDLDIINTAMATRRARAAGIPAGARRATLGLLATTAFVTGCATTSTPQPPPSSCSAAVPPPSQDGPVLCVRGDVACGPKCSLLRTPSGQVFSLVGRAFDTAMGPLRSGSGPAQHQAEITGYIAAAGATVCGQQRNFVAQKVTTKR